MDSKTILLATLTLALLLVSAPAEANCHACVDYTLDAAVCTLGLEDTPAVDCATTYGGQMNDHVKDEL